MILRAILPANLALIPHSVWFADASHPRGVLRSDSDIEKGGDNLGNFGTDANAFVRFRAAVPEPRALPCGVTPLVVQDIVTVNHERAWHNFATVDVDRTC